jgi:hypothetical protein
VLPCRLDGSLPLAQMTPMVLIYTHQALAAVNLLNAELPFATF